MAQASQQRLNRGADPAPPGAHHLHERGQKAAVVQANAQLRRALRPSETRPREHRKAQVNGGGVQGEQLVPKPKAVPRRPALAVRQQPAEQLLVKPMRSLHAPHKLEAPSGFGMVAKAPCSNKSGPVRRGACSVLPCCA